MEEETVKSIFTLDERIALHQGNLGCYDKELNGEPTEEGRKQLELNKAEEEDIILKLQNRKARLLMNPRFLLLIANESDNKVFKTINTYIETQSEALFFANKIIKNLLEENHVKLEMGSYIGIIVRKAFYDRAAEKVSVPIILNDNGIHITSKQIVSSNDGVTIF